LQRFTDGQSDFELSVSEDTQAWDVVRLLGIPEEEVWFVAVGGMRAARDRILHAGDRVDIFAPVGGG
jgi:sulfur carrier protein ThiS